MKFIGKFGGLNANELCLNFIKHSEIVFGIK